MPSAVADRAIRRRTAPLHQNVVLAAEAHDVPDDQEIAGQIELFDQGQFAFDLLPRSFVFEPVARHHAFVRALAQKTHLRSRRPAPDISETCIPNRSA